MHFKSLNRALLALAAGSSAAAMAGETIYVKAGQCILIGSQQVCGLIDDTASTPAMGSGGGVQRMHICQYGALVGSDLPGAKGYSHVLVMIKADGTKTETHIKNFGPLDEHQRLCEAEAKKFQAELAR